MHQPPTDDELVELALEVFRNPPQSYYDWVDEMLAQRRFDARPRDNQARPFSLSQTSEQRVRGLARDDQPR
jgi:hypothetical protein